AAAGRAAIITDNPWWAEYPDAACVRVPNGAGETTAVFDALRRLAGDSDARSAMETAARAHFEGTATIAHMTDGYLDVIEAVTGQRPGGAGGRAAAGSGVRRRLLAQAGQT